MATISIDKRQIEIHISRNPPNLRPLFLSAPPRFDHLLVSVVMGACCSCLDAIRGGGSGGDNGKSGSGVELGTKTTIPPPCHGISRTMSSPTIRIIPAATATAASGTTDRNGGKNNNSSKGGGGVRVSGCGLALGMVPVDQDAAYWEWHIHLPGKIRQQPSDNNNDDENEEKFANFNNSNNEEEYDDDNNDPYALKFGVATRKDRNFYNTLHTETMEGSDTINTRDDGTYLMRPISNLYHGDVIGVAVQQSDLPMIQILLNGEPLSECTITRFRGLVYPAIYIPPGAGSAATTGIKERLEDVDDDSPSSPTSSGGGFYVIAEFEEENFKEMSPHARFGPLLAARGII
jgi:hypothetical protein